MLPFGGITQIIGGLGRGKSLTGIIIANYYYKHGWDIYANSKGITIPHNLIRNKRDLENARRGLLLLDEGQTLDDSRKGMSRQNECVNFLMATSRKRDNVVIVISQVFSAIDKRVRLIANRLIVPQITSWLTPDGQVIKQRNSEHDLPNTMNLLIYIRREQRDPTLERPGWYKCSVVPVHNCAEFTKLYDTKGEIFDFSISEAEADEIQADKWIRTEKPFEQQADSIAIGLGWSVKKFRGRHNYKEGRFDRRFKKNERKIDVDYAGTNAGYEYLYTAKKIFSQMRNATIVYLDTRDDKLKCFSVGKALDDELIFDMCVVKLEKVESIAQEWENFLKNGVQSKSGSSAELVLV
jgi:hypothetical protein